MCDQWLQPPLLCQMYVFYKSISNRAYISGDCFAVESAHPPIRNPVALCFREESQEEVCRRNTTVLGVPKRIALAKVIVVDVFIKIIYQWPEGMTPRANILFFQPEMRLYGALLIVNVLQQFSESHSTIYTCDGYGILWRIKHNSIRLMSNIRIVISRSKHETLPISHSLKKL